MENQSNLPEVLHRLTMFLTFSCNLNCFYCNTIRSAHDKLWTAKQKSYDLKQFIEFLDKLETTRIRHLHLTGGEVTLVKDLPKMIRYSSSLGIPCSITTNGTAPVKLYQKLVDNGLKEIRISFDTTNPKLFDKNVGKKGAFEKVIKSISSLVRMRDYENRGIYLILNVCVSRNDFLNLPETIRKIIRLKSDDIKLIGISHDREIITSYKAVLDIVYKIEKEIEAHPYRLYPLLRKKLKTIFSQDTYGIEDFASKGLMKSCFVPLTERTVDTQYYYPCPVYLREGGQPLGSLDKDNWATQQKKILAFIRQDNCIQDPICQKSCIYCTKVFNNHMNASVYKKVRKVSGKIEPITHEIRYEEDINLDTVAKTMGQIEYERSEYNRDIKPKSFLVIKPNGMKYRKKIIGFLEERKILIQSRKEIKNWNEAALKIYTYPATLWNIYRGILFCRVLPILEGDSKAEILYLKNTVSCGDLKGIKQWIRGKLPPENYIIHHQDEVFITSPGYLHSPDEENIWIALNVL